MSAPDHLKFLESHEWIESGKEIAAVGISDHAQNELSDVVYVELPEVGREVTAGEEAAVEPVPGEVATGDSGPYFLFGLGAEPLPFAHGAIALLNSRLNEQMNSPGVFVDWIRWGGYNQHKKNKANLLGPLCVGGHGNRLGVRLTRNDWK